MIKKKRVSISANDFATVIKMVISVDTSWIIWYMAAIQTLISRWGCTLDWLMATVDSYSQLNYIAIFTGPI